MNDPKTNYAVPAAPGTAFYRAALYGMSIAFLSFGGTAVGYIAYPNWPILTFAVFCVTLVALVAVLALSDKVSTDLNLLEHHKLSHAQDVFAASLSEKQAKQVESDRSERFSE